jgi:hypothetical protein
MRRPGEIPLGDGDEDRISPSAADEASQEDLEDADRLAREYRNHMRRRDDSPYSDGKGRPVNEVTAELKELLGWLGVEDPEEVNEYNVRRSKEFYMDYSAYDVEDLYFAVLAELKGRRQVRFEDLVDEPKETDLLKWKAVQTKKAAEFLIVHGLDENEINEWKGEHGTGRQQRAMRRMHWLLSEPYMSQFTSWLNERALSDSEPLPFSGVALTVWSVLQEQNEIHAKMATEKESWIPRKKDEYEATTIWLNRALNVCTSVFIKDIDDGIYPPPQQMDEKE